MKKDEQLDRVFDAIANDKRRAMIYQLSCNPTTISHLASLTDLSLQAIHKHIEELEDANLIVRKKVGRSNFLALNPKPLAAAQKWMKQFNTQWGSPQATLENYVSNLPS